MLTNQAEYKRQLIGFIGKITAVAKFYAQSILLQGNSHVSPTTAFIIIEDGRPIRRETAAMLRIGRRRTRKMLCQPDFFSIAQIKLLCKTHSKAHVVFKKVAFHIIRLIE